MDRFTRFKLLRAIWARAKHLLAWLHGPRARDERLRAYWHQVQTAQRLLRDGVIRGVGDPDSASRPFASDQGWRAQREAQRQAYETWQRQQRYGR
jgi:hypothetical protein